MSTSILLSYFPERTSASLFNASTDASLASLGVARTDLEVDEEEEALDACAAATAAAAARLAAQAAARSSSRSAASIADSRSARVLERLLEAASRSAVDVVASGEEERASASSALATRKACFCFVLFCFGGLRSFFFFFRSDRRKSMKIQCFLLCFSFLLSSIQHLYLDRLGQGAQCHEEINRIGSKESDVAETGEKREEKKSDGDEIALCCFASFHFFLSSSTRANDE